MSNDENVELWVNNDENLYSMARKHLREANDTQEAAFAMLDELRSIGIMKTPDGAAYTVAGLYDAMLDL